MPISFRRGLPATARRATDLRSLALALTLGLTLSAAVSARQEKPVNPAVVLLTDTGETRELKSTAKTVRELLKENGIETGPMDRISAPLSAPIKDGMTITVTRVKTEVTTERTPIPFPTKQTYSTDLRVGLKVVKQPGKPGERVATYRDYYKDGKRTERVKLSEKLVSAPKPQVVAVGTRGMTLASRGYFGGRRIVDMVATGYGPSGNGPWGMRTSSGLRPGYGVVAVDPRFIPLGTRLFVEGYGHAVAGDTGGAIKGNRIDLGYDSDREAANVGRKRVRVLILN